MFSLWDFERIMLDYKASIEENLNWDHGLITSGIILWKTKNNFWLQRVARVIWGGNWGKDKIFRNDSSMTPSEELKN